MKLSCFLRSSARLLAGLGIRDFGVPGGITISMPGDMELKEAYSRIIRLASAGIMILMSTSEGSGRRGIVSQLMS